MSLLSSQRPQIRKVCMEIDSLKTELRDNPAEFSREMEAVAAWARWQAQLLDKQKWHAA